jgi:pyrroline-5-carboxylate reductase
MGEHINLENINLAFIGGGAMGEAMIKGILARQLATPDQIIVSDPMPARREIVARDYNVRTTDNNVEAVKGANVVILAVKPQVIHTVAAGLQAYLDSSALVISIMAGVPLATMQTALAHERIVRAMPNTPAQVNQGATVWIATPVVSPLQRQQTKLILGALGAEIAVEKEDFLDMQTGLGGSGPGFVFLILEAMIDAGVQMGFSRADAQTIVLQTVSGSVELMRQSGLHPAELRNRVTSPGGTTAAGLYALEKGGLRSLLADGIFAAYRRSQELGRTS